MAPRAAPLLAQPAAKNDSIATAALSLALVPLGLAAVAIFPPFERLVKFTVSLKKNHFSNLYDIK